MSACFEGTLRDLLNKVEKRGASVQPPPLVSNAVLSAKVEVKGDCELWKDVLDEAANIIAKQGVKGLLQLEGLLEMCCYEFAVKRLRAVLSRDQRKVSISVEVPGIALLVLPGFTRVCKPC